LPLDLSQGAVISNDRSQAVPALSAAISRPILRRSVNLLFLFVLVGQAVNRVNIAVLIATTLRFAELSFEE
jgi:hypothetical protein